MTVDCRSGAGELYDLENDPAELANLFDDALHEKTRKTLMTMLESRPDDMKPFQSQVGRA